MIEEKLAHSPTLPPQLMRNLLLVQRTLTNFRIPEAVLPSSSTVSAVMDSLAFGYAAVCFYLNSKHPSWSSMRNPTYYRRGESS